MYSALSTDFARFAGRYSGKLKNSSTLATLSTIFQVVNMAGEPYTKFLYMRKNLKKEEEVFKIILQQQISFYYDR